MPQAGPAMVGRRAERERLDTWARRAGSGLGTAVLVEGEPGIGKTTLLDTVAADCRRLGMRVRRAAAEYLEQELSFAALAALLREDEALAALLRGEGAAERVAAAAGNELVITEAVLDTVDRWCADGPVALILDDAQWIDAASALVVNRLARGIDEQSLLLVVATQPHRDEPATGLVHRLLAAGAQRLVLEPLDDTAVAALVAAQVHARPGETLRRLAADAGGNPLYLGELIRALTTEGRIHTAGEVADIGAGLDRVPRSLADLVLRRLDVLPGRAREILQMAAVLGPTLDLTELAAILELPVGTLSETVVAGLSAGLLVDAGDELAFRHELIRRALAEQLPAALRTALHLRAGQALAATGAPVEHVAHHLVAGTAIDRRTVEWLERVAGELIVRAPDLAVGLLAQALATMTPDTGHRLRYNLVRAQLWDGRPAEAERTAREAIATDPDPVRRGALWWLLAHATYRQGRLADTVTVVRQAEGLRPNEKGRMQGFAGICLFYLERFDEARTAAENALTSGALHDDETASGLGYLALSALTFADGDMDAALELDERAATAFRGGIQPDLQVDPYAMRGYCLLELDRLGDADTALATAVQHNQATGGVYLTLCYALRARLRYLEGRWDDALAEIAAGLDSPDALAQAPGLRGIAALIAIHRGERPDVDALPPPDASVGGRKYGYLTRWAQALDTETRDGPGRALEILYPTWQQGWGLDTQRVTYRVCADLARMAATAGDTARLRSLVTAVSRLGSPTDSVRATIALCRGLADSSAEELLSAGTLYAAAGWPWYEGQAYESAAAMLASSGRTAEAREALDRAVTRYAGLDAAWDIARAEARLRAAGIRRGVAGPRKRPKHGWAALTDTERRVASLVAEGHSNPTIAAHLFLSRRTVQSHVSSILAKLNLRSRVELAIASARQSAN